MWPEPLADGSTGSARTMKRSLGVWLLVYFALACLGSYGCAYTKGAHDVEPPPKGTGLVSPQPGEHRRKVQVVEIGIPDESLAESPELAETRTGLGLSSLVVESLFDTGQFDLLEGEEQILERHQRLWQRTADGFYMQDKSPVELSRPEFWAYAKISYATFSSQGISLGIFSRRKQILRVSVDICLKAVSSGEQLCREGKGEAEQRAGGVIFEYQGDRLEFEKTAAGVATKTAVEEAVREIAKSLPPSR
jgi:curli biogenesis system outer membrane secretion channel CsgG